MFGCRALSRTFFTSPLVEVLDQHLPESVALEGGIEQPNGSDRLRPWLHDQTTGRSDQTATADPEEPDARGASPDSPRSPRMRVI